MKWSKRIFFDKTTGEKIQETGGFESIIDRYSVGYEITIYPALSERNRDTFDVLELPFGAYQQDFAESNGYRVNVETKELEFAPKSETPDEPVVFTKPFSEQIAELKDELQTTQEAVDFLLMGGM